MNDSENRRVERLRERPAEGLTLGKSLRALRMKLNLTMGDVARASCGRDVVWVSACEHDRKLPVDAANYVMALARAIGESE